MEERDYSTEVIEKICLNLAKREQDPTKKARLEQVARKTKETNSPSQYKQLDQATQLAIYNLRLEIQYIKRSFLNVVASKQEYSKFKQIKITRYLISIQEKIDPQKVKLSYFKDIALKKKQYEWEKDFQTQWSKNYDLTKKSHQQKVEQKKQKQIKNTKIPPKIQQKAQPQSFSKIQAQKPSEKEKQFKKSDDPFETVKAKRPRNESSSSEEEQKPKEKKTQKVTYEQQVSLPKRQPKNRVKLLIEYLSNRKDFQHLGAVKIKELGEHLNSSLEAFMKHHLSNLIDVAKLRNQKVPSMPDAGNEFRYFAANPQNLANQNQINPEAEKVVKVNYRSKLQIYSMLRSKEEVLEQKLFKEYETKREEDKKADKKLWDYLLRPSTVDKAENYTEPQEQTGRLNIEIYHVRYLFQNHPYIRNSYLMFNCYNS